MKKNYFILAAIASVALASCSNDEYIGEYEGAIHGEKAISFNLTTPSITRAETGAIAAAMLNNQFVFAGTKGENPSTYVFNQYTAKYVANTAGTTESNRNNWEYVGINNTTNTTQTIKYWDYSVNQYDFAAYSLGTGNATATAIAAGDKSYTLTGSAADLAACYISDLVTVPKANFGQPVTFSFRSLGTKIRIAFYETVPGYSVKDVKFYTSATSTTTKDDNTNENAPTLFTSTAVLPSGSGDMAVSFTDGKAHVTFTASSTGTNVSTTQTFDALAGFPTTYEGVLTTGSYLGRTSNAATYAGGLDATTNAGKYYTVLPYETGANLQLRIKYTLVSTDGSGEEINVDNATAVIPAEFAKWQPNFAYTYIFKISDMTNGSTGTDANNQVVYGLTPITLDAVVMNSEDNGVQETITTVSEPSITTYSEGKVVTVYNDYKEDKVIYIVVNTGTSNAELTVGTTSDKNAALFTATLEEGAAQELSEKSVENLFKTYEDPNNNNVTYDSENKKYTATDANNKKLVLTESDLLSASTTIDADDSPTGNAISVNGAKFTPSDPGNYVFRYTKTPYTPGVAAFYSVVTDADLTTGDNANKLKSGITYYTFNGTNFSDGIAGDDSTVGNGTTYYTRTGEGTNESPYVYTAVAANTQYNSETTYYTFNGSEYVTATVESTETFNGTSYYKYTAAVPAVPGTYYYKLIVVE